MVMGCIVMRMKYMKLQVLKCPECRANLEVEEGRTSCYCQYCGCKIILDDEKKETTINKNINITKNINRTERYVDDAEVIKATNKEKEDKRSWIALAIIGAVLVVVILSVNMYFFIGGKVAKSQGKVSAGYYRDLVGQDYETVVAHFEAAGFKNIEVIDLDDSGVLFWKEGKVEKISVAGDTSFESTDYFSTDSKIVISHH